MFFLLALTSSSIVSSWLLGQCWGLALDTQGSSGLLQSSYAPCCFGNVPPAFPGEESLLLVRISSVCPQGDGCPQGAFP